MYTEYLFESLEYGTAYLMYFETCICDTPLCNVDGYVRDFFCHTGDYDLADIQDDPTLLNVTASCYTNRRQCSIMKYKGTESNIMPDHFDVMIFFSCWMG